MNRDADPERWELEGEPVLELGPVSQDGTDALHLVMTVRAVHEGFLVTSANPPVRVLPGSGAPWLLIGRRGEGPGEYRRPVDAYPMRGDSIVVYDLALRRATVFSAEGEAGRTVNLSDLGSARPGGFLTSGHSLWIRNWEVQNPEGGGPFVETELEIRDAEGIRLALFRGLPSTPVFDRAIELPFGPARLHVVSPFAAGWSIATTDSGFLVGHTSGRWVGRLDSTGEVVSGVCLPLDGRSLDAAALDRGYTRAYPDGFAGDPTLSLAGVRAEAMKLQTATEYPYYRALIVDDRGRLWVERFPREGGSYMVPERARYERGGHSEWWIVARNGELIATLTHPESFTPHLIQGDTIIGVIRDDLDEEWIAGYRVQTMAPRTPSGSTRTPPAR